jgi:glycosyltransferase involved in cell wall biosynthesis
MTKSTVTPDCHQNNSVLLVGPNPNLKRVGGVARHLGVLTQLPALKSAKIYDLGSINGHWGPVVGKIAYRCLKLRYLVAKGDYGQVWVNTSIYPSAFLKLLLIILSLRNLKRITVRVFFHGGRFEEITYLRFKSVRDFSKKILKQVNSFHLLSDEQGKGFAATFPQLAWKRFNNFLPYETPLLRGGGKQKILLFVGRLVREKGVYEVLAAFDELLKADNRADTNLWFVGDGPEMEPLREQIQRRAPGRIKLWGFLEGEALENVYREASVFLLPSFWREGFPYVIIEAMRAGLPIIATPTGALKELIREGENGFLIQAKDPKTLALRIATITDDIELAQRISTNNVKKFCAEFSGAAANEYYRGLLRSLQQS